MKISLFSTHSISFYRPSKSFDEERLVWVDDTPRSLGYIEGTLVEVLGKRERKQFLDGVRTEDAYMFYTDAVLNTADEQNGILPDYAEFSGKKYSVFTKTNYASFFSLTTKVYIYTLVLNEKAPSGSSA